MDNSIHRGGVHNIKNVRIITLISTSSALDNKLWCIYSVKYSSTEKMSKLQVSAFKNLPNIKSKILKEIIKYHYTYIKFKNRKTNRMLLSDT